MISGRKGATSLSFLVKNPSFKEGSQNRIVVRVGVTALGSLTLICCSTNDSGDTPAQRSAALLAAPPYSSESIKPAASDGYNAETLEASAAPRSADSATLPIAAGWLKSVRYADESDLALAPGVRLVMPPVHETALEQTVRKHLAEAFAARGYEISEGGADAPEKATSDGGPPLVVTYSARVANEFSKSPPQSPLRFAPPLSDPRRDDRFLRREPLSFEFDPNTVYFDANVARTAGARALKVSVYLNRGPDRLWAGYANADIPAEGRSALAESIARSMALRLGETVDAPSVGFVLASPRNANSHARETNRHN